MDRMLRIVLFAFTVIIISVNNLMATHNRAGEITYTQIGPLSIEATVTTYTKTSSTGADRDSILIDWGDGEFDVVYRSNGNGDEIPGTDIKVNYYTFQHSYPGRGRFTVSFQDPNRVNNIQNVNYPNSVDVPFYIETSFTLIESQFQGPNNSVMLLQPPVDFACVGKQFVHNPNAYDIDGDSLSYELVVPLQSRGNQVPNYFFPDGIPGTTSILFINPTTGDLVWDVPNVTGEFNVAIKINEYRDGVLLNSVIRDMQILVLACDDNPPEITASNEICVVAGTEIRIPVIATDIDTGQQIRLSATGGPFVQTFSPAILTNQNILTDSPLQSTFVWETKCEHISDTYYQVVFRAQDNSRDDTNGNSVLKNLRIKVLGPPPEDLQSEVVNEDIKLSWASPYACETTLDNSFLGFRVYRKEGATPFEIGECENGLEGKGYNVIKFITTDTESGRYVYTDTTAVKGKIYCYRVLANFAQRTSTGEPFRLVESIPSEEVCIQLSQDIPLITEVSVTNTDKSNGVINVSFYKPLAIDIDTIQYSGPYTYNLYQSDDNINFQLVRSTTSPNYNEDEEIISFITNNLNTVDNQYYYRVDFINDSELLAESITASSIYANIISSDMINIISCAESVPWVNYNYNIEIFNATDNTYDLLDQGIDCLFEHLTENNNEVCYRIQSEGTYGIGNSVDPIFNYSQQVCGTPIDTIGPCPPIANVTNPCGLDVENLLDVDYINTLTWRDDSEECNNNEPVESYRIYFAPDSTDIVYEFLDEVSAEVEREYIHLPEVGITGCYAVSAVDSLRNEGSLSQAFCVDNCPIYILPNTFTPNNDGANDLFVPRQNRFVASVDFNVYNRWGNLIYNTSDPQLNWSGTVDSGEEIPEGTYYYTCKVFELGLNEELLEVELKHGYIQLFR